MLTLCQALCYLHCINYVFRSTQQPHEAHAVTLPFLQVRKLRASWIERGEANHERGGRTGGNFELRFFFFLLPLSRSLSCLKAPGHFLSDCAHLREASASAASVVPRDTVQHVLRPCGGWFLRPGPRQVRRRSCQSSRLLLPSVSVQSWIWTVPGLWGLTLRQSSCLACSTPGADFILRSEFFSCFWMVPWVALFLVLSHLVTSKIDRKNSSWAP